MAYCTKEYGKELIPVRWLEFCEKHNIEVFTSRAIDAAFSDPKLYEECKLFAEDIGKRVREIA